MCCRRNIRQSYGTVYHLGIKLRTSHSDPDSEAVQQRVLRRTNAGVTFRFQSQIIAHRENFIHHLIFALPQQINIIKFEYLQKELNLTVKHLEAPEFLPSTLSTIVRRIITFQTNHVTRILENIYQLIPEIN
jgi:hypothetical protein